MATWKIKIKKFMETILKTEHKKKTKKIHLAYGLILFNLVTWGLLINLLIGLASDYLVVKPQVVVKMVNVCKADYAKYPYVPNNVKEKIEMSALEAGIGVDEALGVANCESRLNPKNASRISTAKGVYQFLNGTWQDYCSGNVFNEDDNIKCFMKIYKKHKGWWECSKILGYAK